MPCLVLPRGSEWCHGEQGGTLAHIKNEQEADALKVSSPVQLAVSLACRQCANEPRPGSPSETCFSGAGRAQALKCSESYWVGLSQDAGKWLWQDGSDTVFEGLWGSAQPDSRGYGGMKLDGELCATFGAWDSQISDSALHDQDCGERHPYICQACARPPRAVAGHHLLRADRHGVDSSRASAAPRA